MELEGTDILEYEIHVRQDARPSRHKPYNYSKKVRVEIEKQVQELFAIKFKRRSTSAWCFNVLLVKKRDKSMMMCGLPQSEQLYHSRRTPCTYLHSNCRHTKLRKTKIV